MKSVLIWFRQDLRLEDNAALALAIQEGAPVIPLFIFAPEEEFPWDPGGAARWWLHHALRDLDRQLRDKGSRLIVRRAGGDQGSLDVLQQVARETGAEAVFWNRRYEPGIIMRDAAVEKALCAQGLHVESANSSVLFESHQIENKSGKPFQVFTPMWRHYQKLEMPAVVKVPLSRLASPKKWPKSDSIESLALLPTISWDRGFADHWGTPSRKVCLRRFRKFIKSGAEAYPDQRDLPAEPGTTQLSPYLHFGQVGPRELWKAFAEAPNHSENFSTGVMRQLIWREFAHHLLFHFPHTPLKPLRPEYELFPWEPEEPFLVAWQRGETGYPIVDAGMRQLWQTGWMHNRVRMIVGSFLVKHLLQPWQDGAQWFWDTLVDADLANNTMGWQWIGGCGADAAPYFRIFNPITQGEKFDPRGAYVRRYLPELGKLPDAFVHKPWEMGDLELKGCGVVLGRDYPEPIIPHSEGRRRALDAFAELKRRRES
jgi:deoxyribodipyrimidine photo-lyase